MSKKPTSKIKTMSITAALKHSPVIAQVNEDGDIVNVKNLVYIDLDNEQVFGLSELTAKNWTPLVPIRVGQ